MKNLTRRITVGLAAAALGAFAAAALFAPTVASAGVVDGSLNNVDILTDIDVLNTAVNSDSLGVNINANTRAEGDANNSTGQHL